MKLRLVLKFFLSFGLPVILAGLVIGPISGYTAYYLSTFFELFKTQEQYQIIVPAFSVGGALIGLSIVLKEFIDNLNSFK